MRQKFLPMFLASLILYGCEKSEEMDTSPGENTKSDASGINFKALFSKDHTMKQAEAEALAVDAARMFYGNGLKAGRGKTIEKTTVIRNSAPVLKSTAGSVLPDTLAYVLNFADSAGFAVICADDRVGCPVLACTGSGVLDSAAIEENPGLAIFMENAEDYIVQKVKEFERSKDSLMAEAQKYLEPVDGSEANALKKKYTGSYTILMGDEEVKPLVKTAWAQSPAPYNLYTPVQDGEHTPAGCWAVAIGQVLGYWKTPSTLDGYTFDWAKMTSKSKATDFKGGDYYLAASVGHLLRQIGQHVNMDYGKSGSSSNAGKCLPWLQTLGFFTSSNDYSWEVIKQNNDLKHPVILTGYREKKKHWIGKTTYKHGHAWVVDGYKTTRVQYESYWVNTDTGEYKITSSKPGYENTYLHNNWGWGAVNDGYFAEGCFNILEYETLDPGAIDGRESRNYRYKLKVHEIWR